METDTVTEVNPVPERYYFLFSYIRARLELILLPQMESTMNISINTTAKKDDAIDALIRSCIVKDGALAEARSSFSPTIALPDLDRGIDLLAEEFMEAFTNES